LQSYKEKNEANLKKYPDFSKTIDSQISLCEAQEKTTIVAEIPSDPSASTTEKKKGGFSNNAMPMSDKPAKRIMSTF
jgi:hypothetical protein